MIRTGGHTQGLSRLFTRSSKTYSRCQDMGRRLLAILGTLAFVGSLAQDVRTAATAAQSPGTIAALQARARNRGGPVRVIVQQTGAFVPEDRQPNAAAAAGQRDRIRETTRQLV